MWSHTSAPPYIFMACCLIKQQGQFYLLLPPQLATVALYFVTWFMLPFYVSSCYIFLYVFSEGIAIFHHKSQDKRQQYPFPLIPSYLIRSCCILPAAVLPIIVIFMNISPRAVASYCCILPHMTLNSICDSPLLNITHSVLVYFMFCVMRFKISRNCCQCVSNHQNKKCSLLCIFTIIVVKI